MEIISEIDTTGDCRLSKKELLETIDEKFYGIQSADRKDKKDRKNGLNSRTLSLKDEVKENGLLKLKVISADFTKNGKFDPYCKIKFSGKKFMTNVLMNQGQNIKWNYNVKEPVENYNSEIKFSIYSQGLFKDDFMG